MIIYFSEVSEKENNEIDNLLRLVCKKKQEKLRRYRFPIDRKLSLYTELLVRKQAMHLLGLNNSEIKFGTNKHGKPFIQGYPQFQFNISHTRNAIAIAFSSHEVGVDIEKVNPPDYEISKRFFTSFEQSYILSHKNPDRAFYEVWTKKEAYIKYIGIGLTKPLKSFDVFDTKSGTSMHMNEIGEYIISYCCNEQIIEEHSFIILTEDEILRSACQYY